MASSNWATIRSAKKRKFSAARQRLALGLGDGQAGVEGFKFGEPRSWASTASAILFSTRARSRGFIFGHGPSGEGFAGGGDGEVDVFLLAGGGGGVVLVGDRVQDVEGLAAHGVNELAVDVVLEVGGQVCGT